jgi:Domain of unknown function DUF11
MAGRMLRGRRGPLGLVRAAAALALLTAAVLPAGMASAQAATSTYPGALRLTVTKVVAGDQADTLGWTYQAPGRAVTATISVDMPAGFTAPQASAPASPGYVSAASASCAKFQVSGTAPQHDGSTIVTVAVTCAKGLTGTISYAGVAPPTTVGKYVLAAMFTPAGGAAVPFSQADIVSVQHGPLASLVVSPAGATIATGTGQTYAAQGLDAFGNVIGNVTASTKFAISPDGRCGRSVCTASTNGPHVVTATDHGVTATVPLTVATLEADLSVSQTVNNTSPYYYGAVSFETTVTNTSSVFWSDGVSATVQEPSGLTDLSDTPSGSTSYDSSTGIWTVGSLAPGASATLDIDGTAGPVSLGTQTVTATVTASTPDPNLADNTASAAEASQPAPVAAVITPDPGNPQNIDLSDPGDVTWYASAVNAVNAAAPVPAGLSYYWFCSTASGNPCPDAAGLDEGNVPLTFAIDTLSVDTYTITLQVGVDDPNYQTQPATTSITFTVSNSGG